MSDNKDPNLPDVGPNFTPETVAFMRKLLAEAQGSKNPEGPTPPQPPQPGQNADVTGARPLHTETTPARQLHIQPQSKPNQFAVRPLITTSPNTGESIMSDDMLEAVSAYQMTSVIWHKTATYTPSSHGLYATLAQMDKTMSTTKRWLDNSFGWIPAYSRLYIGVLFIIQVLRNMRDASLLDSSTLQILQTFEMYYNPGNLLVPGPLVPTFKALSASKADSDLYGNISPMLPSRINMDTNNPVIPSSVDPNIAWHIPNVPAIFDEICTAIQLGSGANEIYKAILTLGSSPGAFGTAFGANNPATDRFNLPGMTQPIALTDMTVTNFYQCAPSYSFPLPAANAALAPGITSWFQYCRFATGPDDHHEWFARLAGTMNNYAQFFRGSIPLGEIPTATLPTGQILGVYRPKTLPTGEQKIKSHSAGTGNQHTTGHYYVRPEISGLGANWLSKTMAIPIPEEWRAFYSQVNCLHHRFTDDPPRSNRIGQFWSLPDVRKIDNVDPVNSIPLLIARKFHRSNRDETI